MKKSSTRFLIAALIVAVLAYIFLYKSREKFEDDDDYEGFEDDDEYEGFENMCQAQCNKGIMSRHKSSLCVINCRLRGLTRDSDNWKCGTKERGPKCKALEERIWKVFSVLE